MLFSPQSQAASVIGSRHDVNRFAAPHVCKPCHIPQHPNAIPPPPHWASAETVLVFPLYGNLLLETTASVGAASRVCLSCHDGVNASSSGEGPGASTRDGFNIRSGTDTPDANRYRKCNDCGRRDVAAGGRTAVFGPGFSSNHPISIPYPETAQAPDLIAPPDTLNGWVGPSQFGVRLYGGDVECGTCHDVHDPGTDGHFLRISMAGSRLCLTCHKK
jgi:predicted CXXCH cytochrome family protein